MSFVTPQGTTVALGEPVGRGGEATVYRVAGQPDVLAKIYETAPHANYRMKLAWMVNHPPQNPTEKLAHASLAWPERLLLDAKGELKGYCMPYIERAVPVLDVFNPRRRALTLPQFDQRYLYRTARNLASALGALHRSGYVVGDINESNVLVTPAALVTLIDTDSFQVREKRAGQEILHPCPVGKPEYTPPELQGKSLSAVARLPDQDAFGLAVLLFQLLMNGSHPFRVRWLGEGDPSPLERRIRDGAFPYHPTPGYPIRPPGDQPGLDALPPSIGELFLRCFVDGHRSPRWRPGPDLWARVIAQAEKSLVCCAESHYYSSSLPDCPYCAFKNHRQRSNAPSSQRQTENWRAAAERRTPLISTAAPVSSPVSSWAEKILAQAGNWAGQIVGGLSAAVAPSTGSAKSAGLSPAGAQKGSVGSGGFASGTWLRQWLSSSIVVGGGQGALAGMIPGAAIAFFNWFNVSAFQWGLILALGGAAGGLLRGRQPGFRLASLINRYIGWKLFWQGAGLFLGGGAGSLLGFATGWAMVAVVLGLVVGARVGMALGERIYQSGVNLDWERIWGLIITLLIGGMGWGVAYLAGAAGLNAFGERLAAGLQPFVVDDKLSIALLWVVAGGASGAFFGALAGIWIDLLARAVRLTR